MIIMSESAEKVPQDKEQSVYAGTAPKKPYQKPKIDWEKKMEPITHALTCALEGGTGFPCDTAPTA